MLLCEGVPFRSIFVVSFCFRWGKEVGMNDPLSTREGGGVD